jgi:hypothetical protein
MTLYGCRPHILAPPYVLIQSIAQINLCKGVDLWRHIMATCLHRNVLICIKVDACVGLIKVNLCGRSGDRLTIAKRVWFTVPAVPPTRAGVPTTTATAATTTTNTLAGNAYTTANAASRSSPP